MISPPAVVGHVVSRIGSRARADGRSDISSVRDAVATLATLTRLDRPARRTHVLGPVAAYAYRQLQDRNIDVAVLVGPSHFVGFDGVAIYRRGGFDSPLGVVSIDERVAARIMEASADRARAPGRACS